ncbi:hypothetical protein [Nonomuraea jabiensis]|uniref:hypothetical protein n=1 Tax=Nonomuraea jabiensis TaxID=882448 RepID=UPI0036A86C44
MLDVPAGVGVPAGKVAALARFAQAARAKAVADLAGDRKLATLGAFAVTFEPRSADEAIERAGPSTRERGSGALSRRPEGMCVG